MAWAQKLAYLYAHSVTFIVSAFLRIPVTVEILREVAAMIDKNDQKQWGDPELDKAQAETDAIFAEMDGLKGLVQNGDMTMEQAQARFIELLERHRLVGERLLAVSRAWGATPGNA